MYIYLNMCTQMTDIKLVLLPEWKEKMGSGLFENIINKMCLQIIYTNWSSFFLSTPVTVII